MLWSVENMALKDVENNRSGGHKVGVGFRCFSSGGSGIRVSGTCASTLCAPLRNADTTSGAA